MAEPLQEDLAGDEGLTPDQVVLNEIMAAMRNGVDCTQYKDILSQNPELGKSKGLFGASVIFYSGTAKPVFEHLISLGDDYDKYELVNQTDDDGNTSLHHAAETEQWCLIPTLVTLGARRDVVNNSGDTPLHLAVGDVQAQRDVPKDVVYQLVCRDKFYFMKDWFCEVCDHDKNKSEIDKIDELRVKANENSDRDKMLHGWYLGKVEGSSPPRPDSEQLQPPQAPQVKVSIMKQIRDGWKDCCGCACDIL